MKRNVFTRSLLFGALICGVFACNDPVEDTEVQFLDQRQEMLDAMQFTAKAISKISVNDAVRAELLTFATDAQGGEVAAGFREILTNQGNISTSVDNPKGTISRLFRPLALEYGNDENGIRSSSASNIANLEDYLKANDMELYAPYFAERHSNSNAPITVSFDPLDGNATSSIGWKMVPISGSGSSANMGGLDARGNIDGEYQLVQIEDIDDDYAYDNPTIFVTESTGGTGTSPGGSTGGGTGSLPSTVNPISFTNFDCGDITETQVLALRMPECKLDGNYSPLPWDRNKFKLWVAKGKLTYVNGLPTASPDVNQLWSDFVISRDNARNNRWVASGLSHFERSWTEDEVELFYAFSRNRGSKLTINGEVAFDDGTVTVDVDVSINEERNETLVLSDVVERCSFLRTHREPTGAGLRNEEAVQSYGTFSFYWQPEVIDP